MILRRMFGNKTYTGNSKTQLWEDDGSPRDFKQNKKNLVLIGIITTKKLHLSITVMDLGHQNLIL